MKRILLLILALAITATTLVSCDKTEASPSSNEDTGTTQGEAPETSSETSKTTSKTTNKSTTKKAEKKTEKNDSADPDNEVGSNVIKESTAGLKFTLNSDQQSYTLTSIGTCTATNIVIGTYNGLPVTDIAVGALYSADIISVTIEDCVTTIEKSAFLQCGDLTTVVIGDGVTSIGEQAFWECWSITTVTVGANVKSIDALAFGSSDMLTSVTFKNPSGWWVSLTKTSGSLKDIPKSDLSNPSTAAKYLRDTYSGCFWHVD